MMNHINLSHEGLVGSQVNSKEFSVDPRTGFVPPQNPLRKLPAQWERWEASLAVAQSQKLKTAEQALLLDGGERLLEEEKARVWRTAVEQMPIISIDPLKKCERELRRVHLVLAFMVQFYAQTVPPAEEITIPRSLTVPLLQASKELQHAPFITYSDHALNNWSHREPREETALPTSDNLQAQTTFTGTPDEKELYMIDIRIELKGAEAVELMRLAVEEIRSDDPAIERIAGYLIQAAVAIEQMKEVLMSTTKLVKPEVFHDGIRPWLQGADADRWNRKWVWKGSEEVEDSAELLTRISGPNAGQSPLIPTLDAYLGLEEDEIKSAFLDRVRGYMICSHREFLQHLRSNGHPIRSFIQRISKEQGADSPVTTAYNAAVKAMKGFRDTHLIIVTLYVIVPSKRAKMGALNPRVAASVPAQPPGTAIEPVGETIKGERSAKDVSRHSSEAALEDGDGFQLMKFLKGFRDQTENGYVG